MGQGSLPGIESGGRSAQSIFDAIAREWSEDWLLRSMNEVRINLTGKVLKVVTANLRDSIGANSRVSRDGFVIGTNVDYGVYWEGTDQGLVDTQTSGIGSDPNVPARSFIREVLERNVDAMKTTLERLYERRLPEAFPRTNVVDIEVRLFR